MFSLARAAALLWEKGAAGPLLQVRHERLVPGRAAGSRAATNHLHQLFVLRLPQPRRPIANLLDQPGRVAQKVVLPPPAVPGRGNRGSVPMFFAKCTGLGLGSTMQSARRTERLTTEKKQGSTGSRPPIAVRRLAMYCGMR